MKKKRKKNWEKQSKKKKLKVIFQVNIKYFKPNFKTSDFFLFLY